MSHEELDQIVKEAPDQCGLVIGELRQNIREAAAAVLEETQDSEGTGAKVRVALALVIDLTKSPVEWRIEGSVSVKHKVVGEPMEVNPTPELMEGMGKGKKGAR